MHYLSYNGTPYTVTGLQQPWRHVVNPGFSSIHYSFISILFGKNILFSKRSYQSWPSEIKIFYRFPLIPVVVSHSWKRLRRAPQGVKRFCEIRIPRSKNRLNHCKIEQDFQNGTQSNKQIYGEKWGVVSCTFWILRSNQKITLDTISCQS